MGLYQQRVPRSLFTISLLILAALSELTIAEVGNYSDLAMMDVGVVASPMASANLNSSTPLIGDGSYTPTVYPTPYPAAAAAGSTPLIQNQSPNQMLGLTPDMFQNLSGLMGPAGAGAIYNSMAALQSGNAGIGVPLPAIQSALGALSAMPNSQAEMALLYQAVQNHIDQMNKQNSQQQVQALIQQIVSIMSSTVQKVTSKFVKGKKAKKIMKQVESAVADVQQGFQQAIMAASQIPH